MSKSYRVEIKRDPEKIMRRLPKDLLKRIRAAIRALADEPRPPGCARLKGHASLWRVRVGNWRIIYVIEDDLLIVLVVQISTRGGAYRDL
jgi:mRNA interferase RelE/StbE